MIEIEYDFTVPGIAVAGVDELQHIVWRHQVIDVDGLV
jgi:hypothetical protein